MSNIVNVEGVESRNNSKEQERERRRQKDRERRQLMSQDEREKHLAQRRKNYQLRRQRAAETNRNDAHIEKRDQETLISPRDSGARSNYVQLVENDESMELAKLMGTIRLSRIKHVARTLIKSSSTNNGAESSNKGESSDKTTRCAMSSGPRLSHVKRMVRSNGQQDQELL